VTRHNKTPPMIVPMAMQPLTPSNPQSSQLRCPLMSGLHCTSLHLLEEVNAVGRVNVCGQLPECPRRGHHLASLQISHGWHDRHNTWKARQVATGLGNCGRHGRSGHCKPAHHTNGKTSGSQTSFWPARQIVTLERRRVTQQLGLSDGGAT
jgi:hypothetical protein